MSRILAAFCLAILAIPARADDGLLRFFPADTKVSFVVNFSALGEQERKTGDELIRQLYSAQLAPDTKKLEKVPFRDITQIAIAQPNAGSLGGFIVVRGKIDGKLLEEQLREAVKASKGAMTVESLGKPAVPVFRRKLNEKQLLELFPMLANVPLFARKMIAPQEAFVAALDAETFLVSLSGKGAMERALRARDKDAKPRTSAELTKLLKARDKKGVATAILLDDGLNPGVALLVPQETRDAFEQFSHVVVRVTGGKKITVTMTANGKTKEDAESLKKAAETAIANAKMAIPKIDLDKEPREVLKGLFDSFAVSLEDTVVTVAGSMSEADARKLLPKVKK